MEIMTSDGAARVDFADPGQVPSFLLALTHGAGGSPDTADLRAVAASALRLGGAVARVTQPYRAKGRRAPGSQPRQDQAWLDVIAALREMPGCSAVPLIQGGRSNGARVACRTAAVAGARGVIALAFPLHPPGHPERSRAPELRQAGTDVLVINGDRDPFGVPDGEDASRVVVLAGETHGLSKNPAAVGEAAASWLQDLLGIGG